MKTQEEKFLIQSAVTIIVLPGNEILFFKFSKKLEKNLHILSVHYSIRRTTKEYMLKPWISLCLSLENNLEKGSGMW